MIFIDFPELLISMDGFFFQKETLEIKEQDFILR